MVRLLLLKSRQLTRMTAWGRFPLGERGLSKWYPSRGAPGNQASVSLVSAITGNSLYSAPMTFPEFWWADSSSDWGETSRAASGQGPVSPSTDTGSLSCFAGTETPSRWEKLMRVWLPTSMQTPRWAGPEGRWCWLLTSPPTHQKNVHKSIMPSLNNCYKPSH